MRVSKNKVNQHLEKELFATLHGVVADLKTPKNIEEFFRAFLSKAEHQTLAKRVAVAYWLDKGRGYNNIRTNLKVSSATIAGIQGVLKKSKGAQLAVNQIKADEWASRWAEKINKFVEPR